MIHTVTAATALPAGLKPRIAISGFISRLLFAGSLALGHTLSAQAVPYTYLTISGVGAKNGSSNGTGGAADLPLFYNPSGVVLNRAGNLYVTDASTGLIREVTPAGVVTTFAGNPGLTGGVDGAGDDPRVSFNSPQGVALDGAGNLYVADYNGATIRKITPAGTVTTLAGTAGATGSTNATGADARFLQPAALAIDATGNLYVADSGNHVIRRITPAGVVTTFAGLAGTSGAANGAAADARFNAPRGLATDSAGNLYVADTNNSLIRKITPAGLVTTLAGLPGVGGATDGTGTAARFGLPAGLTVDAGGNVIVADPTNHVIRKITPGGVVTTVAGAAGLSGLADGSGTDARFSAPMGVATDSTGTIYVTDYNNQLIRKISSAGVVKTVAGVAGASGFLDGTGYKLSVALFWNPNGVAIADDNTAYVADTGNNLIRRIGRDGSVTTLAGNAAGSGIDDGRGSQARFNLPAGLAVHRGTGEVFVADTANHLIRKISATGLVTTLAGTVQLAGSVDGNGANARFSYPSSVAVDAGGNVYVADYNNHAIRKISPAGDVSTLAGAAGIPGAADGAGAAARFRFPRSLAVDAAGALYVADTGNHTIRRVAPNGQVTTVAGLSGSSGTADGLGSAARFDSPAGLAIDDAGTLYVADTNNSSIRAITAAGQVTTVGGTSGTVGTDDGVGAAAHFNHPLGVAIDAAGNIYIADSRNQTIRLGLANGNTAGIGSTASGSDANQDNSGGSGGSGGSNGSGSPGGSTGGSGGSSGGSPGGGSSSEFLLHPSAAVADTAGNLYITDTANNCIKLIAVADGTVTVFAGKSGAAGSTDGTGAAALFNGPTGIATDGAGNYYVCDTGNATIRKITAAGVVTTLAGAVGSRGSKDGTGSAALFNTPRGIVYSTYSAGLFVTDSVSNTIRMVTTDGVVTTYAGTARTVGETDGSPADALFNYPTGLTLDRLYNLYIADTYNHTIRRITTARRLVTATAAGTIVDAGDAKVVLTDPGLTGSPITFNVAVIAADDPTTWAAKVVAAMNANTVVAARYSVSSSGAAIFLRYLPTVDDSLRPNLSLDNGTSTGITPAPTSVATVSAGTVSTVAGSAGISGVYDGTGIYALFNQPQGIVSDGSSNLYVTDTGNNCIRKVTAARGDVTTLAGLSGLAGYRDGAGSAALFNQPQGLWVAGRLLVVDTGNSSLRTVSLTTGNVGTYALKAATAPSASSSGGGGAPSFWFMGALSLAAMGRAVMNRRKRAVSPRE